MSSSERWYGQHQATLAGPERPSPQLLEEFAQYARRLAGQRPPLLRALTRDAMVFAFHRGEIITLHSKWQRALYALALPFRASEYLGLALYRVRALILAAHIPLLPSLLNATCAIVWGIRIGNRVVLEDGIYIPHGQIIVDGLTLVGRGSVLCPWITVGLLQGDLRGPYLEEGVFVGTGAKILGPVRVGTGARIGANAVVLSDVPVWTTAIGAPARTVSQFDVPVEGGASTGDEAEG